MSLERESLATATQPWLERRREERRVVSLQSRRRREASAAEPDRDTASARKAAPSREKPEESEKREKSEKTSGVLVGDRFVVRRGRRLVLVPLRDVLYLEAEGNYVRLRLAETSHLLRATMKSLDRPLSERGFVRIHRSTMVRTDEIAELRATASGDHEVALRAGVVKRWSRGYRDRLEGFLGG